jgi:hypothetical protein
VTDLVGRTVHRVDLASFAVTEHAIGSGAAPKIEPRGAFLRLLLPGLAPGELIAVEDARDLARLWRWAPAREQVEPHPLTGVPPPVLGGGLRGPVAETCALQTRNCAVARNDTISGAHLAQDRADNDEGPSRRHPDTHIGAARSFVFFPFFARPESPVERRRTVAR